jgi:hypothetical protein
MYISLAPSLACTWAPHLAGPLYADIDHVVQAQKVFGIGVTRATGISAHRGPILVSMLVAKV